MPNYDISNLPSPLQEALLQLTERLVQAWASAPVEDLQVPPPAQCAHAIPGMPCCPACAVLGAAEAVLVEVQEQRPQGYSRTPIEVHILDTLRRFYPSPVTARQLADRLGIPSAQMRTYAYALYTLGVIDRESQGHYRYRP
jgi:hypothetical protein